MMQAFPRTALISWCSPESRYAGGEAIRRLLCALPSEHIRWCGFHPCEAGVAAPLPVYHAFPPKPVNWRLEGGLLEQLYLNEWQAPGVADRVWEWLSHFKPERLWAVPEMLALPVSMHVAEMARCPVHATVHDAPETAGMAGLVRGYRRRYVSRLWDLLRHCDSVDCVSAELAEHLYGAGQVTRPRIHVLPPTIDDAVICAPRPRVADRGRTRRIAHCGSPRIGVRQWQRFVSLLAAMPFDFEIVSFTPVRDMPDVSLPANVKLKPEPYAADVADLITRFRDLQVDAAYLGLWRDPQARLFVRTSLSSKLTTYAAAALPIIVDTAPSSVAWRLVRQYAAGVRVSRSTGTVPGLQELFADDSAWMQYATGAAQLAREEFALAQHAQQFKEVLCHHPED